MILSRVGGVFMLTVRVSTFTVLELGEAISDGDTVVVE